MVYKHHPLPDDLHARIVRDLQQSLNGLYGPKAELLRRSLLSKFADPSPDSSRDRRDAAIAKWLRIEERNGRTNSRITSNQGWFRVFPNTPGNFTRLEDVLNRASQVIKRVIGTNPPNFLSGRFSGGASTSVNRSFGMVERKYTGCLDTTAEMWRYAFPRIWGDHLWVDLNPQVLTPRFVDHSILFTVPKSDTIDRVAAKEPDLNMYFQKAAGDFIRRRLKWKARIDLNDQTVNQDLASRAVSIGLATIDLSSASDSVSRGLVKRLLPPNWYALLDDLRVKHTLIDGVKHELNMFSSMGNGFTFELESLIFYALVRAIVDLSRQRGIISVYGDDIIAPSNLFGVIRTVFAFCGFTVNRSKSFYRGTYRESCGKHYHYGIDITPIYIKKPISDLQRLIWLLNSVRKWSRFGSESLWCDEALYPFWKRWAKFVPYIYTGGFQLESIETLVSPKGPGYRYSSLPKRIKGKPWLEVGGYLGWQRNAPDSKDPVEPWSVVMTTPRFVKRRPLKSFGAVKPLFDCEVEQ